MFKKVELNDNTAYSRTEEDVELSNRILDLLNENVGIVRTVFNLAKDDIMKPSFGFLVRGINIFADDKDLTGRDLEAARNQRQIPEMNNLSNLIFATVSNDKLGSTVIKKKGGAAAWVEFEKLDKKLRDVVTAKDDAISGELKDHILDTMSRFPQKGIGGR